MVNEKFKYCDGCGDSLEFGRVLRINFDNDKVIKVKGRELNYCFFCAELLWNYIEDKWPQIKIKNNNFSIKVSSFNDFTI